MAEILEIEKIVYGGYGLGRIDGKICWIPYTLPGEKVEAEPTAVSKTHYMTAEAISIREPSADRIKPPCPHYGRCGGCDFQHIRYERQLQLKTAIIEECAARAGITLPPLRTVASTPFGYRNRLRIRIDASGRPALYRKGSRDPQAIDRCLCVCGPLNRALAQLTESPQPAAAGEERQLYLDRDGEWRQAIIGGHGAAAMMPFAQVNNEVNDEIRRWISGAAAGTASGKRRILDLFCGNGNFSLPLTEIAESITGFDLNADAVAAANRAAAAFPGVKISYRREDLYRFLNRGKPAAAFDFCIADPPAAGLKNGAAALASSGIETVVYISCSPPDLMRDLKVLTQNYTIAEAVFFDMFPQTSKIETGILLRKKKYKTNS